MRRTVFGLFLGAVTLALVACSGSHGFTPAVSAGAAGDAGRAPKAPQSACVKGHGLCPLPTVPPSGPPVGVYWGPPDLQSAYGVDATVQSGATVALIEGGGYPAIDRDLAIYRQAYGLPVCQEYGGCLQVVNATGGPELPVWNTNDARETALDVDMVSATCPSCKILVIQTNAIPPAPNASIDGWLSQLEMGLQTAEKLQATVASISMSEQETLETLTASEAQTHAQTFAKLTIPVVASAGDLGFDQGTNGLGPSLPADFPTVVSVGGTDLISINPRSEIAWSSDQDSIQGTSGMSGGSGCSMFYAAPSFQPTLCPNGMRETPDIAFAASPANPVSVYFTDPATNSLYTGAFVPGIGTSAGAPAIAGYIAYAAGDNPGVLAQMYANYAAHPTWFGDITSGSSDTCTPETLCSAFAGFDGSTGLGVPTGYRDFTNRLIISSE